ncbi:MAG TPA: hypothetical protein VHB48_09470 [Chitinophagaceae bacterium]|nr:hypothetical protein [Chitinophagaceae bacterium]
MKLKTAALILLVSSILWLADMIYYTFNHFFGENAKYYAGHPVDNIISTIFMVVPVSFIIFSITLYRRKPGNIPAQPVDDDARGVLDIEAFVWHNFNGPTRHARINA